MNVFQPPEERLAQQQQSRPPGAGEGVMRRKTTWAFLFVVLLAIVDVGYRVWWGLTPIINLEVFGLLGILGLLVLIDVADVSRHLRPADRLQQIPPLGLAAGSVRAILALSVLGLWGLLFFFGSGFITNAELLDRALTAVGAIVLTIVGFYFGSRIAQRQADGDK